MPSSCQRSGSLTTTSAGRQLFEQGALTRESDAAFGDEGDVSLDISQYERTVQDEEEEAVTERLRLAELSDDE